MSNAKLNYKRHGYVTAFLRGNILLHSNYRWSGIVLVMVWLAACFQQTVEFMNSVVRMDNVGTLEITHLVKKKKNTEKK